MPGFLPGQARRRDMWSSIAVLSAPSNHGGVKSMMWIAPEISCLGGCPLLFSLKWWGLLSSTGCVVSQPFATRGNRLYLEFWVIIRDPQYRGILPRQ
jgi:hypothetical protein